MRLLSCGECRTSSLRVKIPGVNSHGWLETSWISTTGVPVCDEDYTGLLTS
jgi:hypothetical protein